MPNIAVSNAALMMVMNNARDAEDLEECNEMLRLLADHLGLQFTSVTEQEEYETIFGNKKWREVEKLKLIKK